MIMKMEKMMMRSYNTLIILYFEVLVLIAKKKRFLDN